MHQSSILSSKTQKSSKLCLCNLKNLNLRMIKFPFEVIKISTTPRFYFSIFPLAKNCSLRLEQTEWPYPGKQHALQVHLNDGNNFRLSMRQSLHQCLRSMCLHEV